MTVKSIIFKGRAFREDHSDLTEERVLTVAAIIQASLREAGYQVAGATIPSQAGRYQEEGVEASNFEKENTDLKLLLAKLVGSDTDAGAAYNHTSTTHEDDYYCIYCGGRGCQHNMVEHEVTCPIRQGKQILEMI